jgi:hypothetical protein
MNNKLERMGKETVMEQLKALSRHLFGGIDESNEYFNQDSRCSGRESNVASPE